MSETLKAVPNKPKSALELEIERIQALSPAALSHEDVSYLKKIRDLRASLTEGENELDEVRERVKLRKKALEAAVAAAHYYYDNRQMALNLLGDS